MHEFKPTILDADGREVSYTVEDGVSLSWINTEDGLVLVDTPNWKRETED